MNVRYAARQPALRLTATDRPTDTLHARHTSNWTIPAPEWRIKNSPNKLYNLMTIRTHIRHTSTSLEQLDCEYVISQFLIRLYEWQEHLTLRQNHNTPTILRMPFVNFCTVYFKLYFKLTTYTGCKCVEYKYRSIGMEFTFGGSRAGV